MKRLALFVAGIVFGSGLALGANAAPLSPAPLTTAADIELAQHRPPHARPRPPHHAHPHARRHHHHHVHRHCTTRRVVVRNRFGHPVRDRFGRPVFRHVRVCR